MSRLDDIRARRGTSADLDWLLDRIDELRQVIDSLEGNLDKVKRDRESQVQLIIRRDTALILCMGMLEALGGKDTEAFRKAQMIIENPSSET